nr:hypothetical protein [Peptoniphilus lacydonensis]
MFSEIGDISRFEKANQLSCLC